VKVGDLAEIWCLKKARGTYCLIVEDLGYCWKVLDESGELKNDVTEMSSRSIRLSLLRQASTS